MWAVWYPDKCWLLELDPTRPEPGGDSDSERWLDSDGDGDDDDGCWMMMIVEDEEAGSPF